MATLHKCTKCGIRKKNTDFEFRKDVGRRRKQCRACMSVYKKDKYKSCDFKWWVHRIVKEARRRSKKQGKAFNLSVDDVWNLYLKQECLCALTGRIIDVSAGSRLSIDRIRSEGIYELSNVQLTCSQANFAKHAMSMEEFYTLCKDVVANLQKLEYH